VQEAKPKEAKECRKFIKARVAEQLAANPALEEAVAVATAEEDWKREREGSLESAKLEAELASMDLTPAEKEVCKRDWRTACQVASLNPHSSRNALVSFGECDVVQHCLVERAGESAA
jgi:hypothetical protein